MTYNVLGGNVNSITIGLYNSKTKWKHVFFSNWSAGASADNQSIS